MKHSDARTPEEIAAGFEALYGRKLGEDSRPASCSPNCPECGEEMRQAPSGTFDFPIWLGCDQCKIAGVGTDRDAAWRMMMHFRENAEDRHKRSAVDLL